VPGRSYATAELDDATSVGGLLTLKCVRAGGGFSEAGIRRYTGRFKPHQVVKPGEIIVAHTDLTQAATVLGRPAVVPRVSGFDYLVASMHVPIVRPHGLPASYLYYVLRSERFHQFAYARSHGSTVLMLNKSALLEFSAPIPAAIDLQRFDLALAPCVRLIQGLLAESRALRGIRDELLPRLVTGTIRIDQDVNAEAEVSVVA
jgi:type I restriction enzyme, S subunit